MATPPDPPIPLELFEWLRSSPTIERYLSELEASIYNKATMQRELIPTQEAIELERARRQIANLITKHYKPGGKPGAAFMRGVRRLRDQAKARGEAVGEELEQNTHNLQSNRGKPGGPLGQHLSYLLNPDQWPRRERHSVVAVDLVGSSVRDKKLSGSGEFEQTKREQDRLLDRASEAILQSPADTFYRDDGDGAFYVFVSAELACQYAERVHELADALNKPRANHLRLWFRVGIATGPCSFVPGEGPRLKMVAGPAASGAARIREKGPVGGVLIDKATFEDLPHGSPYRTKFVPRPPISHKFTEEGTTEVYSWVVQPEHEQQAREAGRLPS